MDFKNISNNELTQRLEKLVRTERKITHLILLHLNEIESRKIYAELGYDGMFSYLTKSLESSAYRRLQSARLLKQIPSVAEKLETGALNLSQLTQVQKCLKEEKRATGAAVSPLQTQKILHEIEHKNTFETQKVLAVEFNKPVQAHESLKPQADETIRLEITLSKEEFEELKKAKELLSHICPHGSWSDVITMLAQKYNKAKLGNKSDDSVTQSFAASKAESRKTKKSISQNLNKNPSSQSKQSEQIARGANSRPYISIKTKRALLTAANHRCQYKHKNGKTCGSNYQLQMDHIVPKALGGSDDSSNLRILCRTHNNLMAEKLGLKRRI
ncbi:HNH endonuclease signature motif containing protein [Bdellovibrio sp. 22V]|uniref:HNH endonuclease n=1 Tax=Bdellovibrio sp. 22V TaxID=3044166 RepID=UPI002543DE56|nr:HNH endonuclease signature motif containing protein [Bdellovibrio sp. 22V]WII71413.1 HNH endonuclease signature motif containing protein [Bdellovibrio sp. 22V]